MHTDETDAEQPAFVPLSAGRVMGAGGAKYLIGHPRPLDL